MSQALLRRFVSARVRMVKAVEDREAGQGALEYIGMIVVAAVLIVAVLTAFSGAGFKNTITTKVNDIKNAISSFSG